MKSISPKELDVVEAIFTRKGTRNADVLPANLKGLYEAHVRTQEDKVLERLRLEQENGGLGEMDLELLSIMGDPQISRERNR